MKHSTAPKVAPIVVTGKSTINLRAVCDTVTKGNTPSKLCLLDKKSLQPPWKHMSLF